MPDESVTPHGNSLEADLADLAIALRRILPLAEAQARARQEHEHAHIESALATEAWMDIAAARHVLRRVDMRKPSG